VDTVLGIGEDSISLEKLMGAIFVCGAAETDNPLDLRALGSES
jgi:hypothetical protein